MTNDMIFKPQLGTRVNNARDGTFKELISDSAAYVCGILKNCSELNLWNILQISR